MYCPSNYIPLYQNVPSVNPEDFIHHIKNGFT